MEVSALIQHRFKQAILVQLALPWGQLFC